MSVRLTGRFPQYFVNSCNLLDDSFNVQTVIERLKSVGEATLSAWFVDNYIVLCAMLCPFHTLRLFNDARTGMKLGLQNAVSQVVLWREKNVSNDSREVVSYAEYVTAVHVSGLSFTSVSWTSWFHLMNTMAEIHKGTSVYFAVDLLQRVARKMSRNSSAMQDVLARDFISVAAIVMTNFEALYAYKRGDYQRCLQLSTQNVHTLLYADRNFPIGLFGLLPAFVPLFDDDIVSLTAVTLIVNPRCRNTPNGCCITQLTLSLYLMTQCQLKLYHSVTSLARTLDYIKVVQEKQPRELTLSQLTLKLIERRVISKQVVLVLQETT